MEVNSSIPVLTPNNWNTWKRDMQVILMHYGCWQFIIKSEPADPDVGSTYKEKYDFQLRRDRTFILIYTNISPELKSLISDTTDGAVAWNILKDHFQPMTRARVIQLLDDFFRTKYQPGEDVGIFLCRVKTAASRLQEAGHKVDDLYLGFQMIRYVPQEFQSTIQQIYRWKDGEFTAGKIEAELILEANRLQLMKQDLEKKETVFLSSASTSRKSSAVPGGADAVPGDASGNKWYPKEDDDYSRKVTVFPINKKSDVFQTFLRFQRRAERFLGRKIVSVKTDGGLEFCNKDLENFLEQQGIYHKKTNPYTSEQNGVAERCNLTALDGVKTLLKSSGVEQKFWDEVLLCFTYTWNRVCHKDGNKTPFEKYSGKKPSVSHLKPFGCLTYVGVPKQIRKKLDMRAKLGIMMGYALHTKGYRIWLRDENKLIETINVWFDENTKGVDARQNSNQYTKFNFAISNYSADEGDFDTVMDSLSDRLILETSSESPSISREEPNASTDSSFIPCSESKWIRKIGREVTGAGIYTHVHKLRIIQNHTEIEL
ncbi:Retrovirus-related Pol polyprotein from transposon TNT 1-94 [Araneus ventricosus]|uniref:Retrovirus-related Pol polyprotein from transposon TNT 1-94 n=1 Tax=Araneus ventricosus TaxID=182803 RepID=A0A4Y2D6Q0_ARAVE|nr:Retrovirus-related Pol polyprotein from transposon TNT 1-94 [Araneus ventricosus]